MYMNINNILLVVYFGLFIMEGSYVEKLKILKKNAFLLIPLGLFFLLALLAALNPFENFSIFFKHLEKYWGLLAIPITIIACKEDYQKFWRNLFLALLWGCVATLLICYGNSFYEMIVGHEPLHYFWRYRHLNHQFTNIADTHPAYLGLFIVVSIVFLFTESTLKKWQKGALLLFFLLGLLQLASRMAIISVVIIGLVFIISKFKNHWKEIAIGLGILSIVGLLFFSTGSNFMKNRLISYEKLGGDERIRRFKISYDIFTEHPFFGIGFAQKDEARVKKYLEQGFLVAASEKYNAHNQLLEYLSVNGIFGAIVFIVVFTYLIYLAWKKQQYFFLALLLLFLLANTTESMLVRIKGIEFFAITVSLLLISKRKKELK